MNKFQLEWEKIREKYFCRFEMQTNPKQPVIINWRLRRQLKAAVKLQTV